MTRTTPDRPFDLEALFPELSGYARTATLLHPRSGTPTAQQSSVGGPLLWPRDEPWPLCQDPHHEESYFDRLPTVADVRRERAVRAASMERARRDGKTGITMDPYLRGAPTAGDEGRGGIALVPMAQLYARDLPDLQAPPGADVLQVLWCPFDHSTEESEGPAVSLRWRDSAAVGEILERAPEPAALEEGEYLPEPCVLHPEQVTEYPTRARLEYGLDPTALKLRSFGPLRVDSFL